MLGSPGSQYLLGLQKSAGAWQGLLRAAWAKAGSPETQGRTHSPYLRQMGTPPPPLRADQPPPSQKLGACPWEGALPSCPARPPESQAAPKGFCQRPLPAVRQP